MLIMMKLNSSTEEIEKVKAKVIEQGRTPHLIYGTQKLGIGTTGPTDRMDEKEFLAMDCVDEVIRVSKPFKLVSREMKNEDTVIGLRGTKIGGNEIQVIAGPCSIESREQVFIVAEKLKEMGINYFRAGAYKPRSSPYAFQGLKQEGLKILDDVRKEFDMIVVTEAKDTDTINMIGEASDIIQIGARNMQNFSLLEKAGKLSNPILLKRGLSATIEELLMSAEYILSQGNFNVILCERGIRTFETYTRNTLDLNAVPVIKELSHLPVFVDPSHGIGIRNKVMPMAMASVACGADGLVIEVHNKPEEALSDGYQSLTPESFSVLYEKVKQIAKVVNREIK